MVAQIADRIMVLRHGKMVELGATEQILQAPKTDYARALVTERKEADKLNVLEEIDEGKSLLFVKDAIGAYENFIAVKNISISVAKGETVAVVGESGSGKSSLARLILGLLPRKSGSVKFNGRELPPALKDRSKDDLRRIQMIYQLPDVALNPRQTLGEIIGRPVQLYFDRSTCGGEAPGRRTAGAGRPAARLRQPAVDRSFPAARSSASASPARSPPSRT